MGGDGCAHVGPGLAHELRRLGRGDVLEDDAQGRVARCKRRQHAIDKDTLAIKDIHVTMSHLAMYTQYDPPFGHPFEDGVDAGDIGDTRVRVGGGAGRVELGGDHEAAVGGLVDLFGLEGVGEVQRHQRVELEAGGHRGKDALAVGGGLLDGGHRRAQVGHDDRAAEAAGGVGHHGGQGGAVAHVEVPVVGAGEGQAGHGGLSLGRMQSIILPARGGLPASPSTGPGGAWRSAIRPRSRPAIRKSERRPPRPGHRSQSIQSLAGRNRPPRGWHAPCNGQGTRRHDVATHANPGDTPCAPPSNSPPPA